MAAINGQYRKCFIYPATPKFPLILVGTMPNVLQVPSMITLTLYDTMISLQHICTCIHTLLLYAAIDLKLGFFPHINVVKGLYGNVWAAYRKLPVQISQHVLNIRNDIKLTLGITPHDSFYVAHWF